VAIKPLKNVLIKEFFMKKIMILLTLLTVILTGCSHQEAKDVVRVGTIAGPETELMKVAQQVALKRYGLHIQIVQFNDYVLPNRALVEGDIDANAFQHLAYLKAQNKAQGFHLVSAGKTFLYPMGLYSNKIHSIDALKKGDKIALPNDPSNETRALLLLQTKGIITLKKGETELTTHDIIANPKQLDWVTLDAANLPAALNDVSAAVINTTFAKPAGLNPKNALIIENAQSPYTNLIVTTASKLDSQKIKELVSSYQSKAVLEKARQLFGSSAIAGFKV
jgi:D-methionine transport system substrate-binding protein